MSGLDQPIDQMEENWRYSNQRQLKVTIKSSYEAFIYLVPPTESKKRTITLQFGLANHNACLGTGSRSKRRCSQGGADFLQASAHIE